METPPPTAAWQAIETYLHHAYPASPPRLVAELLERLRSAASLYESPAFERPADRVALRLHLRLGNRFYPHMKLVIEESPTGNGCMFRVDTHDLHACPPPGDADHAAFQALMKKNQEIASAIESEWTAQGLPTWKAVLRDDLARRRGAAS